MISTIELLAAAKAGADIPSNYRLARVLGVTDQTVSNWQNGRRFPDDELVLRMAEMGNLNPGEVLVSIYAERAASSPMGDVWRSIAQRVHDSAHGALAVAFGTAVIVSAFLASPDANAVTVLTYPALAPGAVCILCLLSLKRLRARLGRFLADLTPPFAALPLAAA